MANYGLVAETPAQQAVDSDDSQIHGLDTVMALIGDDDDGDALLDTITDAGALLQQMLAEGMLPQDWVAALPDPSRSPVDPAKCSIAVAATAVGGGAATASVGCAAPCGVVNGALGVAGPPPPQPRA